MDRFRIVALENIIKEKTLTEKNKNLAKKTIRKKINIYLKGLKKRKKKKEIIYYENKIKNYE